MNEFDNIALANFNPSNGDYLVVKGKGEYQHLECKHLRGFKIPFLGHILQKIVYPSFRFKKVVEYVFKQEQSIEDIESQALKEKITQYFRLDAQEHAARHKKLWSRINTSYHNTLSIEQVTEQESPRSQRKFPFFTPDYNKKYADLNFNLPDNLLNQLPDDEDYIIVMPAEAARPIVEYGYLMGKVEKHVATLSKAPIVLVICFAEFEDLKYVDENPIDELKTKKLIRDYCQLYRAGSWGYGPSDWNETKDKNNASIQLLLERLRK